MGPKGARPASTHDTGNSTYTQSYAQAKKTHGANQVWNTDAVQRMETTCNHADGSQGMWGGYHSSDDNNSTTHGAGRCPGHPSNQTGTKMRTLRRYEATPGFNRKKNAGRILTCKGTQASMRHIRGLDGACVASASNRATQAGSQRGKTTPNPVTRTSGGSSESTTSSRSSSSSASIGAT